MGDDTFVWGDREAMLRDHAATSDLFRTLVDVRFKLLTFVPTVTAIAVGIVTLDKSATVGRSARLLVGAIGWVASLAVVTYEIRNSQIHDRAVHRIRHLERLLGFRPACPALPPQGMFSERGNGGSLVGLLYVKHDRALAMIYGVVLAAWTGVLIAAGAEMARDCTAVYRALSAPWVKVSLPLLVAIAIAEEIARLGGQGREPALLYTLGDLAKELDPDTDDGHLPRGAYSFYELKGTRIFAQLTQLHQEAEPEATVLKLENPKTPRKKKLVTLAFATGSISDRQVWWFWWWTGRKDREDSRKGRLMVERKDVNWVEAIRKGVVGADEVFRAGEMTPSSTYTAYKSVQQELHERYGNMLHEQPLSRSPSASVCSRRLTHRQARPHSPTRRASDVTELRLSTTIPHQSREVPEAMPQNARGLSYPRSAGRGRARTDTPNDVPALAEWRPDRHFGSVSDTGRVVQSPQDTHSGTYRAPCVPAQPVATEAQ